MRCISQGCGTVASEPGNGLSKAPDPDEGQRTEHQRAQWGADVRQGVPDNETVHMEKSDLPEGLAREKNASIAPLPAATVQRFGALCAAGRSQPLDRPDAGEGGGREFAIGATHP